MTPSFGCEYGEAFDSDFERQLFNDDVPYVLLWTLYETWRFRHGMETNTQPTYIQQMRILKIAELQCGLNKLSRSHLH